MRESTAFDEIGYNTPNRKDAVFERGLKHAAGLQKLVLDPAQMRECPTPVGDAALAGIYRILGV
jgi:hypothetical protein